MTRIDTPEDFRVWLAQQQPTTVYSRKLGQHIPVPCMNTILVKRELVQANTYNPNSVSADKMQLLRQSILDNGWCFPIVVIYDDADLVFVIVDGFHRDRMADADWLDLDYVPVVVLAHDITQRMAATIQFNKARGVHQVDLDAQVVRRLLESGMTELDVSLHLGMEVESVHRYKQFTGIAELFSGVQYSQPWEMEDDREIP